MYQGKKAKRDVEQPERGSRTKSPHTLTNNIKMWRERRGYTQTELADELGVSRVSITNWEAGTKSPSDLNKVALCKVLSCTIYDLFNWEV